MLFTIGELLNLECTIATGADFEEILSFFYLGASVRIGGSCFIFCNLTRAVGSISGIPVKAS